VTRPGAKYWRSLAVTTSPPSRAARTGQGSRPLAAAHAKEWAHGLGHVELAMVQAEAGKTRIGPWVLNCMAPDEGNMHTLLHWATTIRRSATYGRSVTER